MAGSLHGDYRKWITSRVGITIEWEGERSARIKGFGVRVVLSEDQKWTVFLEWGGDPPTFDRLCGVIESALVVDGFDTERARKAVDFWITEYKSWVRSSVHGRQSQLGGNGMW